MISIRKRALWSAHNLRVTDELAFWNRRAFLQQLSLAGAGVLSFTQTGCSDSRSAPTAAAAPTNAAATSLPKGYPAPRNPAFNPAWKLTDERTAATYNNFYEFSTVKDRVHRLTDKFLTAPWPLEIGGLVEKPLALDAQELIAQMTLEERVYRFRCVEAWAMVVPWTGFPLRQLIEKVQPKPEAKYVRFVTFQRPEQAPGFADRSYPWPYHEGLRMDEALHPLTLVATGIYGKPLPKQHGAPLRLVVPWKYGYKSIKSIVKIEFVAAQPPTFWEQLAPDEYPFESNVNPAVPHPRWSQAFERIIDTGDRVRTQLFNGYGEQVAALYPRP